MKKDKSSKKKTDNRQQTTENRKPMFDGRLKRLND